MMQYTLLISVHPYLFQNTSVNQVQDNKLLILRKNRVVFDTIKSLFHQQTDKLYTSYSAFIQSASFLIIKPDAEVTICQVLLIFNAKNKVGTLKKEKKKEKQTFFFKDSLYMEVTKTSWQN